MRLAVSFLAVLNRHAAPLLAVALFVGLALPDLARPLKPLIAPSILLLLTSSMLRIDWRRTLTYASRPGHALLVLVWIMVICPFLIWAVVKVLGPPLGLANGLVLVASCAVLTAVPTYALILRVDAPLSLVVTVAAQLLQPVLQPPIALALLGIELEISALALMGRLALMIGGAFAFAIVLRAIAGPERIAKASAPIGGVAVLMMLIFAVAIMDGVQQTLIARPGYVLLFIAAALGVNFGLQAVSILVFAGLSRLGVIGWNQSLTAALAAGNRNVGILVAVLGAAADADLYLLVAAYQFPMYLIPAVAGPIYRRLREDD